MKASDVKLSSESEEQQTVIEWANIMSKRYPDLELLHHTTNEGKRSVVTGARMKREGMKKGVLDLFLPAAKHNYHGLYIEMKYGKNKLTKEQEDFKIRVIQNGYCAAVCYSSAEAIVLLEWYLGK